MKVSMTAYQWLAAKKAESISETVSVALAAAAAGGMAAAGGAGVGNCFSWQ